MVFFKRYDLPPTAQPPPTPPTNLPTPYMHAIHDITEFTVMEKVAQNPAMLASY